MVPAWFFSKQILWYEWSTYFLYHYEDYVSGDYVLSIGTAYLISSYLDAGLWVLALPFRAFYYVMYGLLYITVYPLVLLTVALLNVTVTIFGALFRGLESIISYLGNLFVELLYFIFYAAIISIVIILAPIWVPILIFLILLD